MCGIAGILHKRGAADFQIGAELLTMSACLQHRGADSAGFVVFGAPSAKPKIEVMIPANLGLPEPQDLYRIDGGILSNLSAQHAGYSAVITASELSPLMLSELASKVEAQCTGSTVTSVGQMMSVRKTVGLASALSDEVGAFVGSHGIAHLRLATESKIDPAHAQPFWARGFPDIAVTHNGHITSYHKLRKQFESRGFSFGSHNDSEVIGIYLGDLMSGGVGFEEALVTASEQLDGSFSFIASTANAIGVTRDPIATKPLLYCETDDLVALASEQQALHHLLGEKITIKEIQPKETRIWERE